MFLKHSEPKCGTCHTLKDAGTTANVLNLDVMRPSREKILRSVQGVGVPTQKEVLKPGEMEDASYVFEAVPPECASKGCALRRGREGGRTGSARRPRVAPRRSPHDPASDRASPRRRRNLHQEKSGELADLVLAGGRVVTVDPAGTEGQSIAMRGDRVLAVGSEAEIRRLIGEKTRVVDLEGRLAIPGFIEGHGHFLGVGDSAMQLDLRQAKTWDEIVALVAKAAATLEPGTLIRGRGWHQEKWTTAPRGGEELSAASRTSGDPDPRQRPRCLRERQGHGAQRHRRGHRAAGGRRDHPRPKRRPTGAFRETASACSGPPTFAPRR